MLDVERGIKIQIGEREILRRREKERKGERYRERQTEGEI